MQDAGGEFQVGGLDYGAGFQTSYELDFTVLGEGGEDLATGYVGVGGGGEEGWEELGVGGEGACWENTGKDMVLQQRSRFRRISGNGFAFWRGDAMCILVLWNFNERGKTYKLPNAPFEGAKIVMFSVVVSADKMAGDWARRPAFSY